MKNGLNLCILCVAMLFVIVSTCNAAIFHSIDTTVLLKCVFSASHQNRVAIDGGRVEKAIFADGKVAIQLEETSGQMFVYALGYLVDPVVISIVTNLGRIQNLKVTFEDRSSEVIILSHPIDCSARHQGQVTEAKQISVILNDLIEGRTPRGYSYFEGSGKCHRVGMGVFAKTIASFEGPMDTIYILRITNQNTDTLQLHERQITAEFGRWAYLAKNILDPQEVTLAILSVERTSERRKPLLGEI